MMSLRVRSARWLAASLLIGGVGSLGCSGTSEDSSLYARLGKSPGVTSIVHSFVQELKADPRINGYFLNASMDAARFESCLGKQLAHAAGGPETYDCKTMKDAHAGHGVSQKDLDDWTEDLRKVLTAAKVSAADSDALVAALSPSSPDVVEDPSGTKTAYQRIGRKPQIQALVSDFHARVRADPAIGSFFTNVNPDRLAVCAVRQVCEVTGGPCRYGEEIPNAEPPVVSACRPMLETHAGLGITVAQVSAFVADLTAALNAAGIAAPDRDALVSAVQGQCAQVVEVGTCP